MIKGGPSEEWGRGARTPARNYKSAAETSVKTKN